MEQIILGIDIGSSKICSLIAEIKAGVPHIIGIGKKPTKGIRKGAITNIEQASQSIRESVNDAKRIAGASISNAVISLSGVYTKSINSSAVINNTNASNDIGIQEINRLMQTALYNANIPSNYEVIHVLPYLFKIDDREYIDDPFGMSGTRLEVEVHVVTVQKSGLENLKKAVKNAGIEIDSIVLSAYASSISTLSSDEKELGVACIDMGANSCNIMVHHGNSMKYDDFLGVGSGHITSDITVALGTPPAAAEDIKINYATLKELSDEELAYTLEIPTIGVDSTRNVSLEIVHNVVMSRVLETLQIIEKSISRAELMGSIGAGIVITGGMANMNGLRELASSVFRNLPTRIALPKDINGSFNDIKDPAYSTVVGLILYGTGQYTNYELDSNKKLKHHQNKTIQTNNFADINVNSENDLSDLVMPKTIIESKDTKENPIIKLDKGKGRFKEKFMKWVKELF